MNQKQNKKRRKKTFRPLFYTARCLWFLLWIGVSLSARAHLLKMQFTRKHRRTCQNTTHSACVCVCAFIIIDCITQRMNFNHFVSNDRLWFRVGRIQCLSLRFGSLSVVQPQFMDCECLDLFVTLYYERSLSLSLFSPISRLPRLSLWAQSRRVVTSFHLSESLLSLYLLFQPTTKKTMIYSTNLLNCCVWRCLQFVVSCWIKVGPHHQKHRHTLTNTHTDTQARWNILFTIFFYIQFYNYIFFWFALRCTKRVAL